MLMEHGFQVALVRGHPVDEGLWLGLSLSSHVLEGQWPVSDVSTGQVWVPIQTPPPGSFMWDIMHFDLAELPYHGLHTWLSFRTAVCIPGTGTLSASQGLA